MLRELGPRLAAAEIVTIEVRARTLVRELGRGALVFDELRLVKPFLRRLLEGAAEQGPAHRPKAPPDARVERFVAACWQYDRVQRQHGGWFKRSALAWEGLGDLRIKNPRDGWNANLRAALGARGIESKQSTKARRPWMLCVTRREGGPRK
jgi:hypothetical protein